MKKLKLAVDQLAVETFHLQDRASETGTVRGNETETETAPVPGDSEGWTCSLLAGFTCPWQASCVSCVFTCPLSCGGPAPTGCNSRYCQNKTIPTETEATV